VSEDDELLEIRRRKMEQLMKMAQEPKVAEPLSKGQVVHLTEASFWSTVNQTKTALIDFFGEWCGPCKALAPIIAQLAADYKGEVFFGKIDIDRNPRVAAQFGVQSVPNIVIFKDGKPIGNLTGLRGYADYVNVIEQLIG
jgi:thioredoxin 1